MREFVRSHNQIAVRRMPVNRRRLAKRSRATKRRLVESKRRRGETKALRKRIG